MSKKSLTLIIGIVIFSALIIFSLFLAPKTSLFSDKGLVATPNEDPSWNNVLARGELLVGVNMPYGSMEFINDKGEPDGFDIDVIKEVANRLGLKVKITNYEWDSLFVAMNSGAADVLVSSIGVTVDRSSEMLFSVPYLNAGSALIIKKDNDVLGATINLNNKKIGVQKNTTAGAEAAKLTDPKLVVNYEDYGQKIIDDLKSGKIDAILLGYEAVSGIVKSNPDLVMSGAPINEGFVAIPTRLGNKSLITRINIILKDMKADGTIKKIEDKWMAMDK